MKLSTSILGIINNQEKINNLSKCDTDLFHLDVMDGLFVENNKLPNNDIVYNKKLDIHLMVEDIKPYLEYYKDLDIEYVTFHYEIGSTKSNIEYIKKYGYKVGLAINPNTKVENILSYLKDVDLVLVMSVVPGSGGQTFIKNSINKINELKKYREINNLSYLIEVDGGINDEIIKNINCDIVVVGNFITKESNFESQIRKLAIK